MLMIMIIPRGYCACVFSYQTCVIMASFTRELLSLPGATSGVWTHFGFPAKDDTFLETDKKMRNHIYCRICDRG